MLEYTTNEVPETCYHINPLYKCPVCFTILLLKIEYINFGFEGKLVCPECGLEICTTILGVDDKVDITTSIITILKEKCNKMFSKRKNYMEV